MPFIVKYINYFLLSFFFYLIAIIWNNNDCHYDTGELFFFFLFPHASRCLLHIPSEGHIFILLPGQLHLTQQRFKLLTYPEFDVPICAVALLASCASRTGR